MKFLSDLLVSELFVQKWHGALNDFFFVRQEHLERATGGELSDDLLSDFSIRLCQRNEGLGADGVVVWERDPLTGAVAAGIWNSDGSRAQTCGNALRCFAALLLDEKLWNGGEPLKIKTLLVNQKVPSAADASFATLLESCPALNSRTFTSTVAMGQVVDLKNALLDDFVSLIQNLDHKKWAKIVQGVSFVQLANPHLVLQLRPSSFSGLAADDFSLFGQFLQSEAVCHKLRIPVSNIGFVELAEPGKAQPLNAIVFERGAGLTQCCGSGGCAMKVALDSEGAHAFSTKNKSLSLKMPGGVIDVSEQNGQLILKGPAQRIATMKLEPVL